MKYVSIQYLRAIAALMVLLVHLSLQEQKVFNDDSLIGIFKVGTAGVDIFFVISGFIMMLILFKKKEKKDFLKKRLIRIYPIYWIYLSLIILLVMYNPALVNAAENASYFRSIFLLPSMTNPLLNVSWTLVYEMYFYLIITTCIYVFQQKNWYISINTVIVLSVIVGLFLGDIRYEYAELKLVTSPLLLEFTLGMFIYYLLNSHRYLIKYKWLFLIIGFSIFVAYHYHLSPLENIQILGAGIYDNRFFYFGLPAFLIVLSLLSFEYENKLFKNGILKKIGDSSFSLYLSHYFVLVLITKVWIIVEISSSCFTNILFVLISTFISLLVGYFSYQYVERPITKYLNKKFGNVTV